MQEHGEAHAAGDFAYVPQTAWCQNLSLRDNIVFGQPWDEAHYRRVIHACALELDLQILAQGDQSKVGSGAGRLACQLPACTTGVLGKRGPTAYALSLLGLPSS